MFGMVLKDLINRDVKLKMNLLTVLHHGNFTNVSALYPLYIRFTSRKPNAADHASSVGWLTKAKTSTVIALAQIISFRINEFTNRLYPY